MTIFPMVLNEDNAHAPNILIIFSIRPSYNSYAISVVSLTVLYTFEAVIRCFKHQKQAL